MSGRRLSPTEAAAAFWAKVRKGPECWLWEGGVRGEYGQVKWNREVTQAHRVAYELAFGPVLAGVLVLHRCDVKLCVRPTHLFLGSHADNSRDMVRKGRHRAPWMARRVACATTALEET